MNTISLEELYKTDYLQWVEQTVALLKSKRLNELDVANLIEEVEDLANRHRDALRSHLTVLIMHLLKWEYQPQARSGSWMNSIKNDRKQIRRLIEDYPSLKNHLFESLDRCYLRAVEDASDETDLPLDHFPEKCIYTIAEIQDPDFWPGSSDDFNRF